MPKKYKIPTEAKESLESMIEKKTGSSDESTKARSPMDYIFGKGPVEMAPMPEKMFNSNGYNGSSASGKDDYESVVKETKKKYGPAYSKELPDTKKGEKSSVPGLKRWKKKMGK